MVPNTPNQETVSPLPILRENKGLIRKKVIWLSKVIKPIVRDHCQIPLHVDQALYGSRYSLKPLDNPM